MADKMKNVNESEQPAQGIISTGQAGWKRWLNYQSVVKQVRFFLLLTFLAVVYIYNGHNADNTIRRINRTAKEVKELKYEYIDLTSEVMFLSKPGEVIKAVAPLGLNETNQSPVILKDSVAVVATTK